MKKIIIEVHVKKFIIKKCIIKKQSYTKITDQIQHYVSISTSPALYAQQQSTFRKTIFLENFLL